MFCACNDAESANKHATVLWCLIVMIAPVPPERIEVKKIEQAGLRTQKPAS